MPRPARPLDALAPFGPVVTAVRWGTVGLGLALAASEPSPRAALAWGVPLIAYAAARTLRPIRYQLDRVRGAVAVIAEVAIALAVVVATGYWASPYVFSASAAIMAAGFARGFGFAIRTALAAGVAVALPYHLIDEQPLLISFQWTGEFVLIGVAAGYARRLFSEAQAHLQLSQQANDLLAQLHVVAQALPTSLDLDEVSGQLLARLAASVPADVHAVLLQDEATDRWLPVAWRGVSLPPSMTTEELPPAARAAIADRRPAAATGGSGGLHPGAAAGRYFPLLARGQVVGVAAAESTAPGPAPAPARPLDDELAEAALAIDNARWFALLRTVGADEERQRIARDLHDRVGQSLAYLSFELDRLHAAARDQPIGPELGRVREDARRLVTEVRDALYDLRTDVSGDRDLVATIEAFVGRVSARTDAAITFEHDVRDRLPPRQEREVWRIAQEAITNAVRHADASRITVRWRCDAERAELVVADDGRGLPEGRLPADSYGIRGMRERAAAVGAALDVAPGPAGGVVLTCRLNRG